MTAHQSTSPPAWADRFLQWYCHEDLIDEIQGDLYETFHQNVTSRGLGAARRKYILDVIRFFRPSSFKKTHLTMNIEILTSYLKVAFRVFKREKGYTLTNVLGLALGLTCSLLIYLWVTDELSYNQWPEQVDRIHYVYANMPESSGAIETWENTPYPLREVLQEKYPSIAKAATIDWGSDLFFPKGSDHISLSGHYGSPELFDIFSIPFAKCFMKILPRSPSANMLPCSFSAKIGQSKVSLAKS